MKHNELGESLISKQEAAVLQDQNLTPLWDRLSPSTPDPACYINAHLLFDICLDCCIC